MEVLPITPRGYCAGVTRAIQIAKETVMKYPNQKVYMLGMIVHNQHLVNAFSKLGIICLEDQSSTRLELLDQIAEGVVIITAHGASDAVFEKAKDKGLTIVDATCPDVEKTHDLVRNHVGNGDVIYIGKKNHPEAEGTVQLSNRVHLISKKEDLETLPELENVLITTQTTLSILDTKDLIEACLEKYPDAICETEICNATRIRQEAVLKLENIDTLFVVGDPSSNNATQLCRIGKDHGIPNTYLIQGPMELNEDMLKNANRVAITSGSSTPTKLTQAVIDCITSYAKENDFHQELIQIDSIL